MFFCFSGVNYHVIVIFMKTLQCHCGHSFEVDVPDTRELDEELQTEILSGSFLSFSCPSCKNTVRPELLTHFTGANSFSYIPVTERWKFLHDPAAYLKTNNIKPISIVFGYEELVERVSILKNGLDFIAVELVKLFLMAQVPENIKSDKLSLRYRESKEGGLVFLASGLAKDKQAELLFPQKNWQALLEKKEALLQDREYRSIVAGPYISYSNVYFEEGEEGARSDSSSS